VASPIPETVSARDLLRHCLATIAYRGGKVLRDVPESFAKFQPPEKARTPEQILAHIGDLRRSMQRLIPFEVVVKAPQRREKPLHFLRPW